MPNIVFVQPDGDRREVTAADGESAMQAATGHLVPGIVGECGGEMSCATCHVFVNEAWADHLPTKSEDEELMLEAAAEEPTKFSRLSCQIKLNASLDGLVLSVPATQF